MNDLPGGKAVLCPACNEEATAIVPQGSEIVEEAENADGKVWVICLTCGHRFIVHYRVDR